MQARKRYQSTFQQAQSQHPRMPRPQSLVWACIICFRARKQDLSALLTVLRDQVDKILILDNSPQWSVDLKQVADGQVTYMPMVHNLGTAGAMNVAWEQATFEGVDAMISFDQDSVPAAGLVARLRASLHALEQSGAQVAAIGPGRLDPRSRKEMRVRLPVKLWRRHQSLSAAPIVEVDHLITSGCLISAEMYNKVGPFREDLFLDYVDIEWSLRARAAGLLVYLDTSVTMEHTIGDHAISVGGRTLLVHQPFRSYLLIRNHLLLWRSSAVGWGWLVSDLCLIVLKSLLLLVVRPRRLERLKWISKAIWHGLHARGGSPFTLVE